MAVQDDVITTYNFDRFSPSGTGGPASQFRDGPRAGDEAPDFELETTEGNRIRLSQYRSQKHVLLEFGSIT